MQSGGWAGCLRPWRGEKVSSKPGQEPGSHPTELLPLYVNRTLPEGLRDEVRAHVQACPACRRDAETWEALARAVREQPADVPDPARAWARLRERIQRESPAVGKTAAPGPGQRLWRAWQPLPPLAWGLVAAQFLLIVGLAVYIATSRPEEGPWTPLAGPGMERPAGGARLEVVFRENASIAEIAELLESVEGQIVRGPSSQGVYVIAVSDRVAREKGLAAVAERFRSRSDLVKWVQLETP